MTLESDPTSHPGSAGRCPLCGRLSQSAEALGATIWSCTCVPGNRVVAADLSGLKSWLPSVPPPLLSTDTLSWRYQFLPLPTTVWSYVTAPTNPLNVKYDGVELRVLLQNDRALRQEDERFPWRGHLSLTPVQRAAVSAHWSALLRAKVSASAERERCRVVVDLQDEP